MINKYQQGGAAPQLGGGVLALIQLLPQEQLQQLMLAFAQWAQLKGVDIQQLQLNPQALEQALTQFMLEMQSQQALMARQGAKLQFIKGLKHQCPEGEHLEYFAKGGAIGCGCVKNQKGGKAEPKKNALEQYKLSKRSKAEQAKVDSLSQLDYERGYGDHTKPGTKKIQLKKKKCGGKMKKHQIGGTLETLRQSLGLEKKNLTKYQVGGAINPILSFQIKQANTLTLLNPTLGGFQVNNGQFDVISAQEGDKVPNGRYLDRNRWKKLPPRGHYTNLPPLEPDVKADNNTYNGGQLPGVTVIAPDLSKPQRFPYGGINVVSKSIRGGLDRKLNTYVNPFEGHDLVASKLNGGEFGGSNKSNRFISEPYPLQTPEIIVNNRKPYRFDRRELNLGNGRGIISDAIFREYINGKYLGDASDIIAGRTIYQTPEGNDTVYGNTGRFLDGYWIHTDNGAMPIMSSSPNGKANFYRNIKKSFVYPSSSYRDNTKEIQAFNRAKQGN